MLSIIRKAFSNWYRRYELNTALYMLEPNEKLAMNVFFLSIFGLITYSSYAYLPHYTSTMLAFFGIIDIEEGS